MRRLEAVRRLRPAASGSLAARAQRGRRAATRRKWSVMRMGVECTICRPKSGARTEHKKHYRTLGAGRFWGRVRALLSPRLRGIAEPTAFGGLLWRRTRSRRSRKRAAHGTTPRIAADALASGSIDPEVAGDASDRVWDVVLRTSDVAVLDGAFQKHAHLAELVVPLFEQAGRSGCRPARGGI